MKVYVDEMHAEYGRMKRCNVIADTDAKLHEMLLPLCGDNVVL